MFQLNEDPENKFGNINTLLQPLLLLILRQLPPSSFFSVRLASRGFRALADNECFMWEPQWVDSEKSRTLELSLGIPKVGGEYYLATQFGAYRWPGGSLFLCRDRDNAIERKKLTAPKLETQFATCEYLDTLIAHESRITVIKQISINFLASGDETGNVFLWSLEPEGFDKIELTRNEKHHSPITAIARSSQSGNIMTADEIGQLMCWNYTLSAPLWKINFPYKIVSLKILPHERVEVIVSDFESKTYHLSVHDLKDGTKICDKDDVRFGNLMPNPCVVGDPLLSLCSFFNNSLVEFSSDTLYFGDDEISNMVGVSNLGHQSFEPFSPPYFEEECRDYQSCVMANSGNLLFWKKSGEANLVYHKFLPLTFGKEDLQEDLSSNAEPERTLSL